MNCFKPLLLLGHTSKMELSRTIKGTLECSIYSIQSGKIMKACMILKLLKENIQCTYTKYFRIAICIDKIWKQNTKGGKRIILLSFSFEYKEYTDTRYKKINKVLYKFDLPNYIRYGTLAMSTLSPYP